MLAPNKTAIGTAVAGTAIAAGAGILLRRYSRTIRASWDPAPEFKLERIPGRETDRLIVVHVGAFNCAYHVTGGVLKTLLDYGDVLLVKYTHETFDMDTCVRETLAEIRRLGKYEQFVLLGGSMGFIASLSLYTEASDLMKAENTVALAGDPAQCREHLPWAARFARHIRPGPILNRLSPPVTRAMFRITAETTWSPGTDKATVAAHIAAMRKHPLSVILPMIAAIEQNVPVPPERLVGLRAVGLYSGTDPVINGPASRKTLFWQFGERLAIIPVNEGGHVDWVEHAPEWSAGIRQGFETLGVPPLAA